MLLFFTLVFFQPAVNILPGLVVKTGPTQTGFTSCDVTGTLSTSTIVFAQCNRIVINRFVKIEANLLEICEVEVLGRYLMSHNFCFLFKSYFCIIDLF